MPVTMPRPAASQPVRSGSRPGMPSTAAQPRSRHLRPRRRARSLDALRPASPWCSPLSTPANTTSPADRLSGAHVAASGTPSSNLVQNQGDRVFRTLRGLPARPAWGRASDAGSIAVAPNGRLCPDVQPPRYAQLGARSRSCRKMPREKMAQCDKCNPIEGDLEIFPCERHGYSVKSRKHIQGT